MNIREKLLAHKYKIVIGVFFVWMLFFDKNNFIDQYKLRQQYHKILDEQEYYREQIAQAQRERDELSTNADALEKFAREKYHMKKDDEEVFIIVKEEEQD